jgi:hypothetical protein
MLELRHGFAEYMRPLGVEQTADVGNGQGHRGSIRLTTAE